MSSKYLREEATAFPLSLALEDNGFILDGLEMVNATGEEGLAGDFSTVAIDREPIGFAGEPNGDFSSDKLGPLGNVSTEDKSDASFVGLTALAFFFDPLGIGGEGCVVVSVAKEAARG